MVNREFFRDRKTLVTTIGAAALGLGLIATASGVTSNVMAQEVATPPLAQEAEDGGEVRARMRSGELREELYAEFTAALADELGIGNADEVDAAIRVAMMTVVDARVDDGLLTAGQAEALKTLIATSDVPLGPGPMFAPPPGAFIRGGHGPHEEGWFLPIPGGDVTIGIDDASPADDGEDDSAQDPNDDAGASEEGNDGESS